MIRVLTFLLCVLFNTIAFSQTVVINELDVDTSGYDTKEFIELKSFDTSGNALANFTLDGYIIVLFNENTQASYYTIDLTGQITDANGILLVGNSGVSPSPSLTFPNNTIQNGPDVVAIYQDDATNFSYGTAATTTNLIDVLAYATNTTQPSNLMATLGTTTFANENENNAKNTQSIQRKNNGTYEVKDPTPGVNNDGSGIVLNYISVTTPQTSYSEGDSVVFSFTTSQPVQNETLIMTFTLVNGNFALYDFTGSQTVSIPVGQSSTQATIVILDDGLEEEDEEMLFQFQPLPAGYIANNDNFKIRIYDVNFASDSWGTPLNPSYGIVTPTTPSGYYSSLEGLSGSALKQAVQDIIADPNEVRAYTYADVYEILRTADRNPENNNQVWQLYTETAKTKLDQQQGASNIGVWNREHIFPQSRGGFQNGMPGAAGGISVWVASNANDIDAGHSDAHHIRVADGAENSSRSNKDYGSDYNGPTGNLGSWKGDVARALFYMAVRYNGLSLVNGNPNDNIVGQMGDLTSLLTWNTQDPADDFEMNRNNYIYTWQQNRNPFIDYPLLADYIFGSNYGQPWYASLSEENFATTSTSIKVYPNPATDYIIIEGTTGISLVEIYTLTGQCIMKRTFSSTIQLPINIPSGIYMVTVTSQGKKDVRKIIIR